MSRTKNNESSEAELQKSFDQWDALYEFGGHDPFWPDGVNLNLVRNHILYYKKQIEESCEPENYPAIYHRESPPEVSQDYMARADEIRENAKHSLALYKQDENYCFLLTRVDRIDPKEAKRLCVRNVINYTKSLEAAIASDDLVTMRRHENSERYLPSFEQCAQRVRELKLPENEQLSLFSLLLEDEDEPWEEEESTMSMNF
ncbi:hypothetical protein DSOL_3233 [Desulfosporosinus metallidurans]|uniref:Uncharacterized protein n=1 Tax=Desulfosporosinus metallidurans TaxID=1888891 RepID=A0A1Q8QRX4_9FIRM|nr:hypothetical protein DSOL_3233 [Desulfosporosinus metallidurans]